MPWIDQMYKK